MADTEMEEHGDALGTYLAKQAFAVDGAVSTHVVRRHELDLSPPGFHLPAIIDVPEHLVVFDLDAWPPRARLEFDAMLSHRNVEHAWMADSLMVPDQLEWSIDELIDEISVGLIQLAEDQAALSVIPMSGLPPDVRLGLDLVLSGNWHTFLVMWDSLLPPIWTPALLWGGTFAPHAWIDGDLLIHEADKDGAVLLSDAILSGQALVLTDDARLAYDVSDFDDDALTMLVDALFERQIPHELSPELELYVHESDEEAVEILLDEVDHPDQLPAETYDEPGRATIELMSDIFVACDRLKSDLSASSAIRSLGDAAEELADRATPYGFGEESWTSILIRVSNLVAVFSADELDFEQAEVLAAELARDLRPLV